jgi:hypothetical protein
MVGDGQWVTLLAIAELELALEIGTPQIIGKRALRQRRAARAVARSAAALDQAVAIEHRMNGAPGGNPDVAVEPAHQQFADLAGAPVRLLALQPDDQGLELLREPFGSSLPTSIILQITTQQPAPPTFPRKRKARQLAGRSVSNHGC